VSALLVELVVHVVKIAAVIGALLGIVAYGVLLERRVCAWIQDRHGPNRVGPFGLFQPIADGVKLFLKEDILPHHVQKVLYTIAPPLVMLPALLNIGVIPWGSRLPLPWLPEPVSCVIADLDIGILFVFAFASFSVYGIVLAGWASNSKYPFLGGIRSSAQMISYEVCLGLSVVPVFMEVGSLNLGAVVEYQAQHGWLIVRPWQWVSFLVFLTSAFAETNRLPFDFPEAEQELVGGYNTEYSSMKFGMLMLGEYAALVVMSALMATLFLGGWSLPVAPLNAPATTIGIGLAQIAIFLAKTLFFMFVYIWVRWTLPRFRYDQLMTLGWKVFVPVTIANIVVVGAVMALMDAAK